MAFALITGFRWFLKKNTDTDTETQGYIFVVGVEPVPDLKAVLISRFGRGTKRIAASNPSVCDESFNAQLIAYGGHQCTHS